MEEAKPKEEEALSSSSRKESMGSVNSNPIQESVHSVVSQHSASTAPFGHGNVAVTNQNMDQLNMKLDLISEKLDNIKMTVTTPSEARTQLTMDSQLIVNSIEKIINENTQLKSQLNEKTDQITKLNEKFIELLMNNKKSEPDGRVTEENKRLTEELNATREQLRNFEREHEAALSDLREQLSQSERDHKTKLKKTMNALYNSISESLREINDELSQDLVDDVIKNCIRSAVQNFGSSSDSLRSSVENSQPEYSNVSPTKSDENDEL